MGLTEHEQHLVDFALEQFGEPLSQFLLAGLGREELAKSRILTITFAGTGGVVLHRDVQISINELPGASGFLPRRRDPLVILALLNLLLMERRTDSATLFYEHHDVLNHLKWEDTPESIHYIDEVVERYADLTYCWTLSGEELAGRNLSFHRGKEILISGYCFDDITEDDEEQLKRVANQVDFSVSFIEQLMRKTLFELNWNSVLSVT
jgi:hypothetical protein